MINVRGPDLHGSDTSTSSGMMALMPVEDRDNPDASEGYNNRKIR
jgi:hypothetical protein